MGREQILELDYGHKINGFHSGQEFINRDELEVQAYEFIRNRVLAPEVAVLAQERQDNARTLLMEALTASGHLSPVYLNGSLEDINRQVLSRLVNGWDETLPEHEQSRRFAELCNELYIQKVHAAIVAGVLPPHTEVLEISDYPEALNGTKIGYRHQNKKGMVRSTGLRHNPDGTFTRVIEQVSRSNGTWQSTYGFLESCGIKTEAGSHDLAVLNTPIIYSRYDYIDGVVDVIRLLDTYAGARVRYGDIGERALAHPDYHLLREESIRREKEIEVFIDDLAELEEKLDTWVVDKKISLHERSQIFAEEVDRILSAVCTLNPEYASDTFGARAVKIFDQAAVLAASGQADAAAELIKSNEYMKDDITFCGVTISVEQAQLAGLNVTSFQQLLTKGKEVWKWKSGKCRVPNCPTPKPSKVGPCSVCRNCQHHADKGANLMKLHKPRKVRHNKTTKKLWYETL